LAHAYHHRVVGHNHAELKDCFRRATESNSYDSVLHIRGEQRRHYALNNDQEYFAEATEAYFGTNDFYPFVRAELKQHDPEMFDLVGKLWNKPPKD
jgi:dipeptidyl-peptidase-4